MGIQTEIDRINTSVAAAYAVMKGMGATMPSSETVDNIAATAATMKPPGTVRYDTAQTLTDAQKDQARENIAAKQAPLIVNIATEDGETYTADKTYDEIVAAADGGREIFAYFSGLSVPFLLYQDGVAIFQYTTIEATDELYAGVISFMVATTGEVMLQATSEMIPTQVSQLENDSGFVDGTTVDGKINALAAVRYDKSQSLTTAQKTQARNNIGAAAHYYAVCSTAAATAAKTVTVDDGFALVAGTQVTVKFTYANSVASPTLNVNGTGAKPIYRYGTTAVSTGTTTSGWIAGCVQVFTYDGTGWIRDYWNNTTYSNLSLGQGYATCSTAAATVAKTVSLSSYSLAANGIVAIKFTNDVPAGATLNINSKGAKAIYHRGAAITAGVIKAGDTATFIYSTYYHLLTVDRDNNDGAGDSVSYGKSQSLTKAQKVQARQNIGLYHANVKDYGAKGDNATDDTTAFQNALANERVVFVPGGSYKISGELVMESNCQLELAQDAVLYFTQTTGNCISMKMSANIVGNHATISVPYTFSGNVINIDGGLNTAVNDIPPFAKWDPMWKTARYITDLNIVKPDTRGFYYSMDGTCSGVAVYLCADYTDVSSFIWATNLSKLRIAGAFTYGIFAESFQDATVVDSSGWIHQLRVDGFIDGPEVALYLKNIESAYASVIVLPRRAFTTEGVYIPYAKWGICLENSINTNLLGSRVMDWNSTYSLWAEGNMYQHIALLGTCTDVKLDDFLYYANPNYDIRSLIYTDTPSNLDSVSILEEPITRWFKPVDGVPYFNDGFTEKQLMLREEMREFVDTERTPDFTDVLKTAIDENGTVFNGIGYVKSGYSLGSDGAMAADDYCGCTGFIPVKQGDTIYVDGIHVPTSGETGYGNVFVCTYDSSFTKIQHGLPNNIANLTYFFDYEATDTGFILTVLERGTTAYIRFSYPRIFISDRPAVSINQPITYSQNGYLRDGILVKVDNVEGLDAILGSYINDVDALLGGD